MKPNHYASSYRTMYSFVYRFNTLPERCIRLRTFSNATYIPKRQIFAKATSTKATNTCHSDISTQATEFNQSNIVPDTFLL